MSWPVVPFNDLLEDVTGGNEKTKQSDYAATGAYPIVDQGQSLIGGYTDDTGCLCKTDEPVIIFGDHTKALKYVDFPFCLGADGTKVLKPKQNADTKYLYYALHNIHIPDAGYSRHFKYLKAGQIPLPPLEEQKRIAGILDQADALRCLRTRALDKLNTLGQAIFHEMFVENAGPDWKRVKVDDVIVNARTGPFGSQLLVSEFVDAGIPVLGIDNVVQNKFVWAKERYVSSEKYAELERYTVLPGDLLITIMGTCGRCAVVPDDIPTAINTKHICCMTLDRERIHPLFLQAAFLNHPGILRQLGVQAKGAVMPGLNMGIIKGLTFQLPPIELQNTFAERVASIAMEKCGYETSAHGQEALFASLQYRAFRGEL